MNYATRLLLALSLFASAACQKKEAPKPGPILNPSRSVMVSLNGAAAVELTNVHLADVDFSSSRSRFTLDGELPDKRVLTVRYFYGQTASPTPQAAPIAELTIVNATGSVTVTGSNLNGTVTNNPVANTAGGFFSATLPNGESLHGAFQNLPTR